MRPRVCAGLPREHPHLTPAHVAPVKISHHVDAGVAANPIHAGVIWLSDGATSHREHGDQSAHTPLDAPHRFIAQQMVIIARGKRPARTLG